MTQKATQRKGPEDRPFRSRKALHNHIRAYSGKCGNVGRLMKKVVRGR